MANLLAKSIATTIDIERQMGVRGGWEEAKAQFDLDADPKYSLQIECAVLLRKARLHSLAVHQANESSNLHSLAVQMRPVLECAGQVVFIMHNLMIVGGERGLHQSLDYHDATAFRYFIETTKDGGVGRKELRKMLSSVDAEAAALVGAPKIRTKKPKRSRVRQADKVSMLPEGVGWYDYLSKRFCHGQTDWKGPSYQGGVISIDTVPDEIVFAVLMDYLANQVAVMNAYAMLCPISGDFQPGRMEDAMEHLRNVRADSGALRGTMMAAVSDGSDKTMD